MKKILCLIICLLLFVTGCAFQNSFSKIRRSNVVDYLYPKEKEVNIKQEKTHLHLPLKVGIAFVPKDKEENKSGIFRNMPYPEDMSELQKQSLLQKVKECFSSSKYVSNIQTIPTNYLQAKGGFENLDQLSRMYGIDVIVLLSYDQMQFAHSNLLSLSYISIVGAYIIEGEKNETQTLVDAVVYDIKSKKMLFRAPGFDKLKNSSTQFMQDVELQKDSQKGFDNAINDMNINLNAALIQFRDNLEKNPAENDVQITKSKEYVEKHGAGYNDYLFLFISLIGLTLTIWKKK